MDAQHFLTEFGHIANALGGTTRLRDLILSLAFKGQLCPHSQHSSDSLLADIQRLRLAFDGETRKQRITRQSVEAAGIAGPYTIPAHWAWVSLSTVGHTWGQKKPDGPFVYINVSSIDSKDGALSGNLEVLSASAAPSRARKIVRKGTIIYSTVRPYLLNIAIVEREFDEEPIASTAFAIVHPWKGVEARYLYYYLRSPAFVRYIESVQTGMAYPAISDEKFYSGLVPLPPSEEQARIVAKVDELMGLCDQLEAQQQNRRKLRNTLRQSALDAVVTAANSEDLQSAWARLAENFETLFSAPEDVGSLRSACVELAIRGELSDAGHADQAEPAETLISAPRPKTGSRTAKIDRVDEPFPLPKNWTWVLLEDLLTDSESGWSPKCDAEPRRPGEWGVLKVSAVTWGEFRPEENKRLPPSLEPRTEFAATPGDFLLSRANTAELVARSVVVPDDCPGKLLLSDKIVRLNFIDPSVKPWVNSVNNSRYARDYYRARATGTSDSMRNVSRQVIHELPIPLAPRDVQRALLHKLGQLHALCDQLEAQLREANEVAAQFAASAVASLTGVNIEQEEAGPVKPPDTELVAPLRLDQAPDVRSQAPLAAILARHNGEMSARDLWQRFGGEIDAFYAQLKTEVGHGWIADPSYDLDDAAPEGPRKYPDGALVARVLVKEAG
ncbi:MAG TPA: restriction endonuclease subunit S [Longimicrobiaceae bacterium]|nr:restriction endonuclease subunit S [Longimicrobiaceae bacterium]